MFSVASEPPPIATSQRPEATSRAAAAMACVPAAQAGNLDSDRLIDILLESVPAEALGLARVLGGGWRKKSRLARPGRFCWLRAVPTPIFALEVQRGEIPGQPGAYCVGELLMKISSSDRRVSPHRYRGEEAFRNCENWNLQGPEIRRTNIYKRQNLQEIDCRRLNFRRGLHQN